MKPPTWKAPTVLLLLLLTGCGSGVDDRKVVDGVRQAERQAARLHEVFPEAATKVSPLLFGGWRHCTAEAELANGFRLFVIWQIEVKADGASVGLIDTFRRFVRSPKGDEADLSPEQLDVLLDAWGDAASLKTLGIDFDLKPMASAKVIAAVRQLDPRTGKLYQVFPHSRAKVHKPAFEREGLFTASAQLADGFELSLDRPIRVSADGQGVELRDQPPPRYSLYSGSEVLSMELTPEQFDAIVEAKGDAGVVKPIWARRATENRVPDRKIDDK